MKLFFHFTSFLFLIFFWQSKGANSKSYIDYYNKVHYGEYLFYEGFYSEALVQFDSAFQIVSQPYPKDLFYVAKIYAIESNPQKSLEYIEKIILFDEGIKVGSLIKRDSVFFENICNDPTFANRISEIQRNEKLNKAMPPRIIQQIDTINHFVNEDYMFRFSIDYFPLIEDTLGWEKFDKSPYGEFQNRFVTYIKENGFPGHLSGCPSGDILLEVLLHLSPRNSYELKPFLLEELKSGNVSPFLVGAFLEKIARHYEGVEECTFKYLYNKCSIKDPEWSNVIKNRLSIGGSIYYKESWSEPRAKESYIKLE